MKKTLFILFAILPSFMMMGQPNGKFQMHFINVGQGDAALLITPEGKTVLFDEGQSYDCELPVKYLYSLGLKSIDYLVTSHYHEDHIGCTKQILDEFPLQVVAYDRGESYVSSFYDTYVETLGDKRKTADTTKKLILDEGTGHEVVISFLVRNGAGIKPTNENDKSLVALVTFGNLDIMMGGDLSGYNTNRYKDIETTAARKARQVEVYKVHHHCSEYSTNTNWLDTINPMIAIISVSGTKGRIHEELPSPDCLERLHQKKIRTYWTDDGKGADADPKWDKVGGDIVVEASPGNNGFTVKFSGNQVDTYSDWGVGPPPGPFTATYAWSKNSKIYHYSNCSIINSIKPANLQTGSVPPMETKLHPGCPK
jgi:competence protein ComEC